MCEIHEFTCGVASGWHSNIFCTAIFVLGQGESQGSITEIVDGQKSNLLLSGQGSTLHFTNQNCL